MNMSEEPIGPSRCDSCGGEYGEHDAGCPEEVIPAHWKMYHLYMHVPRLTAKAVFKDGEIKTLPDKWDFGPLPAASALHAVDSFWKNVPHIGPALLDADGQVLRKRRIKKLEVFAEEVADAVP